MGPGTAGGVVTPDQLQRARLAYLYQRRDARRRGIGWGFRDFASWWAWWQANGWPRRGNARTEENGCSQQPFYHGAA
jgi:hypothetical protein